MDIQMPCEVLYIIDTLQRRGFEAYTVGGCVRDSLLGKEPKDWDICTPALPDQIVECFEGGQIIDTGLRHGTVTLVLDHKPFEITTYRVDGKYSDHRRPDKVMFVNVLKRDLARRDFTINAMAYNPTAGLVDYYDGQHDLFDKKLRCVGNPNKRFSEDALRIMRALRFASVLGFSIEEATAEAMLANKHLLGNIAAERITAELNRMITGDMIAALLLRHSPVITEIIPELKPLIGFAQNNPHHCYDVWEHTLRSVDAAPKDNRLRLALLLHDIAKPVCYTETDGVGHFYGHPQQSADMAKDILLRLKYDKDCVDTVVALVLHHDTQIEPNGKHIKRWLHKIGEERLRQLVAVKRADATAQSETFGGAKHDALNRVLTVIDEVIEQRQCFSFKDLAVNGRDLIALGITEGVQIGAALKRLMDMVIDEEIENDREKLLQAASCLRKC